MDKRKREFMEKLDSIYKIVQQSSTTGISAVKIAEKLGKPPSYRTTVHRYLNTLEFMGKVYSEKGLWFPKNAKQTTIRDLFSEIRAEVERIKEDFINKNIESANRRLYLLLKTELPALELPNDLRGELNSLTSEYEEKLTKISIWDLLWDEKATEKHRIKVGEKMIPKFLGLFRKICMKLEEGAKHE